MGNYGRCHERLYSPSTDKLYYNLPLQLTRVDPVTKERGDDPFTPKLLHLWIVLTIYSRTVPHYYFFSEIDILQGKKERRNG